MHQLICFVVSVAQQGNGIRSTLVYVIMILPLYAYIHIHTADVVSKWPSHYCNVKCKHNFILSICNDRSVVFLYLYKSNTEIDQSEMSGQAEKNIFNKIIIVTLHTMQKFSKIHKCTAIFHTNNYIVPSMFSILLNTYFCLQLYLRLEGQQKGKHPSYSSYFLLQGFCLSPSSRTGTH